MLPNIQGKLSTIYRIMRKSWTSWSSPDVTKTQPPQESVRSTPVAKTRLGSVEEGYLARLSRQPKPMTAKRGPAEERGTVNVPSPDEKTG